MAWLNRFGWLIGPKNTEAKIVIIGLVNSGKSTIVQQLKPYECKMVELIPNIPIVGLHGENFTYKGLTFASFDLGDLDGIGNPWEDHYKDCHGIIFVVDSADRLNMPLVRMHFEKCLKNQLFRKRGPLPVLVLANKRDKPGAVPYLQLADLLATAQVKNRPCEVFCCDGLTGEGLNEALDWLAHQLRSICSKQITVT